MKQFKVVSCLDATVGEGVHMYVKFADLRPTFGGCWGGAIPHVGPEVENRSGVDGKKRKGIKGD